MLRAYIPDLILREGMIETVLLQAWAEMTSELIFATNRIPSAIFESLLQMYGIYRDFGEPPTATLRFEVSSIYGTSIPAESAFVYDPEDGREPIVFVTEKELVVPEGETIGTVLAVGDRFTSEYNTTSANTYLQPIDSYSSINYVQFDDRPSGGRDPETELEYFTRGVNRFRRLTSTLIVPDNFVSYVLEEIDVERARAIDNWDGTNNASAPGHITIAVYGNEEPITTARKAELKEAMESISYANLIIHVVDPTITPVDVSIKVRAEKGYETPDIVNNVVETLEEFISPMSWDWSNTVWRNEIISKVTNAVGVDFVLDLTVPTSNLTIPGAAPLAIVDDISVEVEYE